MPVQFSYRFETISNIKEKIEADKKNKFGLATQKLLKEKENLNILLDKKNFLANQWKEKAQGVLRVKELLNLSDSIQRMEDFIEKQVLIVKSHEIKVNDCRNELVEAKKQTKIFEKIREKDYRTFMEDLQKKETAYIDQLISHKSSGK